MSKDLPPAAADPDTPTDPVLARAEKRADELRSEQHPHGPVGRRLNWRSPFLVALLATLGVAVGAGIVALFWLSAHVLLLVGVALFLAIGLDPAVSWLVRRHWPRWAAVLLVLVVIAAGLAGFVAAAVPPVVSEAEQLIADVPVLLQQAQDHSSWIGHLNDQFGLQDRLQSFLSSSGETIAGGVFGVSVVVFGAIADLLVVIVLTIYLLADLPRVRSLIYRVVPGSRRPRAILLGDEIMAKVGRYVLGNLVISLIAGVLTFVWLTVFGVPYSVLLSLTVAVLDIVPVVGSTVAGLAVTAVALTVSLPVALATVGFFVVYRFLEDYLLVPRIIGRAVDVPPLVTVVAVLAGASLLGLVGALVAIPISAGVLLLVREMLFPRVDAA